MRVSLKRPVSILLTFLLASVATVAIGVGPASATAPNPPTNVAVAVNGTSASITFTGSVALPAPDDDLTTTYTIEVTGPVPSSHSPAVSPTPLSGLTPGDYSVVVTANNGDVVTTPAPARDFEVPVPDSAPSAPAGVVNTLSGANTVVVTWTDAVTAGNPVEDYTVTLAASNGGVVPPPAVIDRGIESASFDGLAPGTYLASVQATHGAGSPSADAAVPVVVPVPDSAPSAPTGVVNTLSGANTVVVTWIDAATAGNPVEEYTVTLNPLGGGPSQMGIARGTQTASFPGLDPGSYAAFVFAINDEGNPSAGALVAVVVPNVAGPPDAPGGVNASATGATTATVNWDAPADNGAAISGYTVTVEPAGAAINVTGTDATATGLISGVSYTFAVVASNAEGAGPAGVSNAVVPNAVPGEVAAPTVVSTSPTSATISWIPPTNSGSAITSYRLILKRSSDEAFDSQILAGDVTQAIFEQLNPGESYTFSVVAINAAGDGPFGSSSAEVTLPDVPDAPGTVTAARDDEIVNLANVNWSIPDGNGGTISGYMIRAVPADGDSETVEKTVEDPAVTSDSVGSLDPGTYTFEVRAINEFGEGPASVSSSVVIPDVPGLLQSIVASNNLPFSNTVTITWEPPNDTGGAPIVSYVVTMAGVEGVVDAATNSATIGPLPPGFHEATIQARTIAGEGPELISNQIEVRGFAPFGSVDAFIDQQYLDFLGRASDGGGRAFWASRTNIDGSNVEGIIASFMASAEFAPRRSVVRLYQAYFNRSPDLAGFDFWAGRLAAGEGSLEDVSQFFAAGVEFEATYGDLSNEAFVDLVYDNVLGRSPDAGGRAFWIGRLGAGLNRGTMMTQFSESPEFIGTSGAHVDVVVTYRGLLNRLPDGAGYNFWTTRIADDPNAIGTLIRLFFSGAEYGDRVSP